MKKTVPSASAFLIVLVFLASTINAQSVISGMVLGHDGRPMQKALVVMAVGSVREKTITVNPDEAGRFRYETNEKGLHFLNFSGAKHLQQLRTIDGKMAKQFEVMGIPTAFLVDESGKIIATTEALRGEKLIHVLNELFKDQ